LNFEIKKIRLDELQDFVKSEMFRHFTTIPISELRIKSYVNNPHSQPGDFVLYLGFVDKQLVAFRSLFAGGVQTEPEKQRFAWCSGNWVHPEFRRKGFSERLLKEAYIDWNGKLMFTNYAPNSEKLYLKSGNFHAIHQFDGFRGYLFPKTRKLIQASNRNGLTKAFFSVVDFVVIVLASLKLLFYASKQNSNIRFETIEFPDAACFKIIEPQAKEYIFNRGEKELRWIFQFPWITANDNNYSEKYPFSSYSKQFFYQTVKVFFMNEFVGFFIFSVRDGHLKTLYFNLPAEMDHEIAEFLKLICVKHKIEVITVYKSEVANQFFTQKFPFLHAKKFGQKIYSSFEIGDINNSRFQDGDGDAIFT